MDNEYILTATEQALFQEVHAQLNNLNQQAAGALKMLLRIRSLDGAWDLSPDYSKLTRSSP